MKAAVISVLTALGAAVAATAAKYKSAIIKQTPRQKAGVFLFCQKIRCLFY